MCFKNILHHLVMKMNRKEWEIKIIFINRRLSDMSREQTVFMFGVLYFRLNSLFNQAVMKNVFLKGKVDD